MKLFGVEINRSSNLNALREDLVDMQRQLEDIGWIKINYGFYGDSYSLLKEAYDRMVQRSRLAFIRNPIVAQAIHLTTNYTFGDGLSVPKAEDAEVQGIIDEFWKHPDNKLSLTDPSVQLRLSNKLQYDGELAFMLQVDLDGTVYTRVTDPLTIVEIIHGKTDNMRPLFYKRRIQSRNQFVPDWHNGLALIREEQPEAWKAMLKEFDIPEIDVLKDTYIYHVKNNNDLLDPRGVPEVYRALDWMNAHSKMNSDCASFINAQAQYAWKKKISGTQNQVAAMVGRQRQNTGLTNPAVMGGSTYVHNDKVDMEAVSLASSTGQLFEIGIRRALLMMCAAFGIMEHYFGDPSTGNLATSKSMELPMLKKFLARRKLFGGIYLAILNFQLDMKLMALNKNAFVYSEMKNRLMPLPSRDYKNRNIDIPFPPILEKDIKQMAAALSEAKAEKLIPIETAQRHFMQTLGVHDIDAELKKEFETAPEPPPASGGGAGGGTFAEAGVKGGREKSLKLAEKNKTILRKMEGYKKSVAEAYRSLVGKIKEETVAHRMPGGRFVAALSKAHIQSSIKMFEHAMMAACHKYYPEVVDISERYVRSRVGKLKESGAQKLLEKKLDTFTDDQIKWNSDFVKKSLAPALMEKFDSVNSGDFATEADVALAVEAAAASQESRVGMYVSSLWTVAERAVKEAAQGTDAEANFVGVDDDATCDECGEALDGNPYSVDDVPIPGEQQCLSNCRHAIQIVSADNTEEDTLSESDIQLLRDAEAEAKQGVKLLKEAKGDSKK